jgi:hypothetical protein
VSSLSAEYVNNLLTGSQRRIEYILLPTLLDANLGQKEAEEWADSYLNKVKNSDKNKVNKDIPNFKKNLLRSSHLLVSGHPRSLENLVRSFINIKEINLDHQFHTLLKSLTLKISRFVKINPIEATSDLIDKIFSTDAIGILQSPSLRALAENGTVLLLPCKTDPTRHLVSTYFGSILILLSNAKKCDLTEKTKAISMLFDDFFTSNSNFNISDFWERCVALTIFVRSFGTYNMHDIIRLNTNEYEPDSYKNINLRIMKKGDCWHNVAMNELVLSPPSYPGFDGILVSNRSLLGVDEVFFLQMKIGDSIKNNTNSKATVLAKTIFFSVEHQEHDATVGPYSIV